MLCPEVWNLKSPSNAVTINSGFSSESDHCESLINNHHFNHNISVVLPGCPKIPEILIKELKDDCDYYKVNLPVTQLIEKKFLDLFINIGELTALSVNTRIDVDNCACITPSGILVLSLVRETYQKLGIAGTPWGRSSAKPERYAVCIDLKQECFKPGKPNYDRIYKCFSLFMPLHFDFIIAWEPPTDKNICPSTIASYLHTNGHDIRLCETSFSYKIERNLLVPPLMKTEPGELIEWLGALTLGILKEDTNIPDSSLEYLNSYKPPYDSEKVVQIVILNWTGFLSNKTVSRLFTWLRDYTMSEEAANMPWISLNVNGFSDSPVSFGLKHHSFHTSGDNSYTCFITPQKNFITFRVTPQNLKDTKKEKKWVYVKQNCQTK